tara:strand:- start:10641 stop:11003 length:363 start_codon:yes stop_codon:yes gene_type:complete
MIDTEKNEGHACKWCKYFEDANAWHYEDCPIMDDPMVTFHIHKNYEMQKEVKRLQKLNDLLYIAFHRAGDFGLFMTLCDACATVHFEDDVCAHACEFCGEMPMNISDGQQCCEAREGDAQ